MFQIKVVLHHLTMKEKSSKYLDIVLIIFALKPWMTILTLQKVYNMAKAPSKDVGPSTTIARIHFQNS